MSSYYGTVETSGEAADNGCLNCCTDGERKKVYRGNNRMPLDPAMSEVIAPKRGGRFDINVYATKKSAASGLMDIALLMANASQLKHVILIGNQHYFYWPMLLLLITSILLQLGIGVALLFLAKTTIMDVSDDMDDEYTKKVERNNRRAEITNNVILAFILLLTFINVFISAFGLDSDSSSKRP